MRGWLGTVAFIGSIASARPFPAEKPAGVTLRRITDDNGDKVVVRAIDANSTTFGEDLLYVFNKNVEAARLENKRLLGSRSGVKARP